MKLHMIRGGDLQELNDRMYTIGVGISLGNKWFTVKNIVGLTKWCLEHTKDNVIIYVADSIHAINLEVRNQISNTKAAVKADQMGSEVLDNVRNELQKQLTPTIQKKILYVKWNEFVDEDYKEKLEYLRSLYENNKELRETIHSIVKSFISKEDRTFTDKEINRLGEYLIEEMPELINRVEMKGIVCDAYAYPFDGEMVKFIEKIQKGEILPEIKDFVLETKPKVFLEVR